MPTEVLATPRADQQIAALSRRESTLFNAFVDDLAARGCAALSYRLSGPVPVDHVCVKHLRGEQRVVVGFESPQRAWILLVGPHHDDDQEFNIYTELYRLLGVEPPAAAGRTKPPCCDVEDQAAPVLGPQLDDVIARAQQLRRSRRRG
ncbi:hypothetical protein GCM10010435_08510 [Winogradskya consettensis]|uniref:Uncharacterized protein n=1 Tax=Winogradskya consettensis TaxID=113560 RepID=A0A919T047_9ACTN|nr:hypothetical protein [Actinoplanes consettensis]GIM80537.1 hypothetical protein Aco04nite_71230 [Actinoplanes consettensis]